MSHFHTVTSTVTKTNFATCYAAEPGIVDCQNKRDNEESEPKIELNGEAASWESIISPSRTERVSVCFLNLFWSFSVNFKWEAINPQRALKL